MTASTRPRTARDIAAIMDALNYADMKRHFNPDADSVNPYVVCDGVSVEAFNQYIADDEELPVRLRFLDLSDDGRLMIVDLSTTEHESALGAFSYLLSTASGNGLEVGRRGGMGVSRPGLRYKAADATFGPKGSTPNRTPPPPPRSIADWVTLAVEVGRSQTWASLTRAAEWWAGYAGVQYVLLLKINASATEMEYRLYDIAGPGDLSETSTARAIFQVAPNAPPVNVHFDMHRILSIPVDQALPDGMNAVAVVNLRTILDYVMDNI